MHKITKAEFLADYETGLISEVENLYPFQNWIVGKRVTTRDNPAEVVYIEYIP